MNACIEFTNRYLLQIEICKLFVRIKTKKQSWSERGASELGHLRGNIYWKQMRWSVEQINKVLGFASTCRGVKWFRIHLQGCEGGSYPSVGVWRGFSSICRGVKGVLIHLRGVKGVLIHLQGHQKENVHKEGKIELDAKISEKYLCPLHNYTHYFNNKCLIPTEFNLKQIQRVISASFCPSLWQYSRFLTYNLPM